MGAEAGDRACPVVIGGGANLSVELDLLSLLKGSEPERWQADKIAAEIGAVSPNEIRQETEWGPRAQPQPVLREGEPTE